MRNMFLYNSMNRATGSDSFTHRSVKVIVQNAKTAVAISFSCNSVCFYSFFSSSVLQMMTKNAEK